MHLSKTNEIRTQTKQTHSKQEKTTTKVLRAERQASNPLVGYRERGQQGQRSQRGQRSQQGQQGQRSQRSQRGQPGHPIQSHEKLHAAFPFLRRVASALSSRGPPPTFSLQRRRIRWVALIWLINITRPFQEAILHVLCSCDITCVFSCLGRRRKFEEETEVTSEAPVPLMWDAPITPVDALYLATSEHIIQPRCHTSNERDLFTSLYPLFLHKS